MIEYYKNFSLENLFYINENGLVCQEEFRDIPEYEGHYQASNLGRIKSLERWVSHSKKGLQFVNEKILKQTQRDYYLGVALSKNKIEKSINVHQLVYCAFNGCYPKIGSGKVIDHIEPKQKKYNCLWNLQVLTIRGNSTKDLMLKKLFLGVRNSKNKWYARIYYKGKSRHLGMFDTETQASEVYKKAVAMIDNSDCIEHLFKEFKKSPTGEQNIYFEKNKFAVRLFINRKYKRFGYFNTLEEAVIVRDRELSKSA